MKSIKQFLFMAVVSFLTISCGEDDNNVILNEDNNEVHPNYPFEEINVSISPGKAKIITLEKDTLAVLTESSMVSVPKFGSIEFEEIDNSNNIIQMKIKAWQTIAFEDSRNGDFDYNDLVIHCKITQTKTKTKIDIHPIAMGASKKIELWVEIDGIETCISSDARTDIFKKEGVGHIEGFINTDHRMNRYKYMNSDIKKYVISQNSFGKSINWFIKVDDDKHKLYAVSKNMPSEKRPYGLIFVKINKKYTFNNKRCGSDWFDYPKEGCKIEDVYPYFFDKGKTFEEIYNRKTEGLYYNAIDADEDRNVTENSLYTISKK